MTEQSTMSGTVVLPYYAGPAIGKFTTALLWSGKLVVPMGAWISPEPIQSARSVIERARQVNHRLLPLFNMVMHHSVLAQVQGLATLRELKVLGDRIQNIVVVGPGTPEAYAQWQPLHDPCLAMAGELLNDTQVLNATSIEFLWRVHEHALEQNGNADAVLRQLDERASLLGDPQYLLVECALHRHAIGKSPGLSIVTDQELSIGILQRVGEAFVENAPIADALVHELGFLLFESLLGNHVPIMIGDGVRATSVLFEKHDGERSRAKEKCLEEARTLVNDFRDEKRLRHQLSDTVARLEEEVTSILEIDKRSFGELGERLTQDGGIWSAVVLLAGGLATGNVIAGAASAGVTALTSLGANALGASRHRREALRKSPWAFAYRLRTVQ